MKCNFCGNESNHVHVYACGRKNGILTKSESWFLQLFSLYGEIINKVNFENEYIINKKSLPKIKEEFGIPFEHTLFLIEYHGLKKRNMSEANSLVAKQRKKTCLKKYGVENPSQSEEIKEKKRQTFLKNYGVDNIRKYKPFYDYVEKVIFEKYGKTRKELLSEKLKKIWDEKSWIDKMAIRDSAVYGKLEDKVRDCFEKLQIPFIRQYPLGRYLFDFLIFNNLLIEVNGTFWHADPRKYASSDELNFNGDSKKACEIWEKDLLKREKALQDGFRVITLWENDINSVENLSELICSEIEKEFAIENKIN